MMNGGIHALSLLFLLTLASQGSWCAAESKTTTSAQHQLQMQEFHGKKNLDIQITRNLGHGQSLAKHEVSAVEIKHDRRMATGHKGGSSASGGGGSVTRRHSTKNGTAALPVPLASVLALSLAVALLFRCSASEVLGSL